MFDQIDYNARTVMITYRHIWTMNQISRLHMKHEAHVTILKRVYHIDEQY